MLVASFALAALALTRCGSNGSSQSLPPPPIALGNAVSTQSAPSVSGDMLRINSINGTFAAAHAADVYVKPGDVVFLSADIFLAAKGMAPAGLNVESFVWNSSLSAVDICDASQPAQCVAATNFQVSDYGVAFYTPYTMPETVQVTVRAGAGTNELDATGHPIFDSILLHNMAFNGQAGAAPVIITPSNLADYPGAKLSPDTALAGLGRWVTLDNVRYFTPVTYIVPGEAEWAPYRHGYWGWEEKAGTTWISNDPWGWMTDHYGVWRHHATYGWMWLPFEDVHYEPHCVTFFGQGEYMGWAPFHSGFPAAYIHGSVEGFDDGFWLGFHGFAANYGQTGYGFHPGFAVINHVDLNVPNLIGSILTRGPSIDVNVSLAIRGSGEHFWVDGFEAHGFAHPTFLTPFVDIQTRGGLLLHLPRFDLAARPLPPESVGFVAQLHTQFGPQGRPIALGTIARANNGQSKFLLPTSNNRVLVAPPVIRNESGVPVGRLPVHTAAPAVPQAGNPIAAGAARRNSAVEALPTNAVPKFNPKQQAAPSIVPVGAPVQRAGQPAPVVQPPARPNPAPAPAQPAPPHQNPGAPAQPARPNPVSPTPPAPARPNPASPARPAPAQPAAPARPATPAQPAPPAQPAAPAHRTNQAPARPAPAQPATPAARPTPAQPAAAATPTPSGHDRQANNGAAAGANEGAATPRGGAGGVNRPHGPHAPGRVPVRLAPAPSADDDGGPANGHGQNDAGGEAPARAPRH